MRTPSEPPGYRLIPEDADPCVWMTAGFVSYKLCDRALDCDHCPLDAALGGRPYSEAAGSPVRCVAWVFPGDRRYALTHAWAKPVASGNLRLGIDAFAAELLATVGTVRPVAAGTRLESRGGLLCDVDAYAGRISVRVPIRGSVAAVNDRLASQPELVVIDPYDTGWIVDLSPEAAPEEGTKGGDLLSAEEMRERARSDKERFRRQVAMTLLVAGESIGVTMTDGGEPCTDIRHLLGRERYRRLVECALANG